MELTIISKGVEYKCLYDEEDHELISEYTWYLSTEYARACIKGSKSKRLIYMARLIMGIIDNPDIEVDHINHNRLDNQKTNLRVCTRTENARNVSPSGNSKYLGVYIHNYHIKGKKNGKPKVYEYQYFDARILAEGKRLHLGNFKTEEAAAKAYDIAAKKHFKEFANLNFK